jgi:hypothetical protein
MATFAPHAPRSIRSDDRFFLVSALVMAATIVAGFSLQFAAGRSSFSAPPLVHAHALVFMGWVVIYVSQSVLATTGGLRLHRKLGWLAAAWMVPMLFLGCAVTIALVRAGRVPFFFTPLQFIALDVFSLFAFVGLMIAGIVYRRRTQWHRRLNFCAMTLLLAPAVGRLLPMPLLIPYSFEAVLLAIILFPIAGMIADIRRTGKIHPAWQWGMAVILGHAAVTEAFTHTDIGLPLYRAVTAGTPGAGIAPNGLPPSPLAHLNATPVASI